MIGEIMLNIDKSVEMLRDMKARIQKDETVKVATNAHGSYVVEPLKSSKADIERTCKMARNLLKECYGDNYKDKNYRDEIKNIVLRMEARE